MLKGMLRLEIRRNKPKKSSDASKLKLPRNSIRIAGISATSKPTQISMGLGSDLPESQLDRFTVVSADGMGII